MSAFLVDQDTIDRVVALSNKVIGREWSAEQKDDYGRRLWSMNRDAVLQRYPDRTPDDIPGPAPTPDVNQYRYGGNLLPIDGTRALVRAIKSAQCLRYQCSEGDVPGRQLYAELNETIQNACLAVVESLPEYAAATWG